MRDPKKECYEMLIFERIGVPFSLKWTISFVHVSNPEPEVEILKVTYCGPSVQGKMSGPSALAAQGSPPAWSSPLPFMDPLFWLRIGHVNLFFSNRLEKNTHRVL